MFQLRSFILSGLLGAVGNQPDYIVIQNAAGWLNKGVLLEPDLAQIQDAIDAKNKQIADAEAAKLATVEESPVISADITDDTEVESNDVDTTDEVVKEDEVDTVNNEDND